MRSEGTVVILNPAAGTSTDEPHLASRLHGALGAPCRIAERPGQARELARDAARAGASIVVAAGGDGTVRDVARGIVEGTTDRGGGPSLGVVPLGTGNDLARSLQIPPDWREAAEVILSGSRVRRLDLLRLSVDGEEQLAVNSVIVGNGARPGSELDEAAKSRWGPLSYLRKAVDVALELEPIVVEISVDGSTPRELEVLNVMIANGATAGGGVPIAAGGSPFDGWMEVTVIAALELSALVKLVTPLLRGEEPEHDGHHQFRVRHARIRATGSDPFPISMDGESGEARELEAAVLPARLPVLVPAFTGPRAARPARGAARA